MNIKEIIDAERWDLLPYHLTRVKQHNACLDRIEDAVTKRIAELKAQLPKVAKPTIICDGIWSFACGECQRPVNRDECYCAKCGAKLDWT